jgi:phenylacetic acid degradation operon negative regulatory protein
VNSLDTPASVRSQQTRSVLVTYLGAIVRRMGNWMPIAGTVELMTQYGLDTPGVRTAVHRLKQRDWLLPESRDGKRGYALTEVALAALAAGDDIVWHARPPADLAQGWCIVNFSVPEAARNRRHQLRAHLSALGFGNIGSALWIAPARMSEAAEYAIAELDLTSYCAIFLGDYIGGQDLKAVIHQSWDFQLIDVQYREFISRFDNALETLKSAGAVDAQHAFVSYLAVIEHWRRLAYRDPGLPRELFDDSWSAPAAVELFERLVATLEGRALAHAAVSW